MLEGRQREGRVHGKEEDVIHGRRLKERRMCSRDWIIEEDEQDRSGACSAWSRDRQIDINIKPDIQIE